MRKHSRGVQLISLDFINFPWITKTGVSNFELVIRQKISVTFTVRMDGWTDGWTDGRMDGDQKGPSIFLIFMYVKDHVYMYLYTYSKVVTKILMGFKI